MNEARPDPVAGAMRRLWPWIGVAALFSAVLNLLMLASPLYMMQVLDRVLSSGSVETLVYLTLLVAGAFAVLALLDGLRGTLLQRLGLWLEDRAASGVIEAELAGRLAGRGGGTGLQDLATLRAFLGSPAVQPLLDAPWLPIFLAFIWLLHPWLGLLGTAAAVLLLALAGLNELVGRTPERVALVEAAAARQGIEAALRNADVVHGTGMLPALIAGWRRRHGAAIAAGRRAADGGQPVRMASRFLRLFAQSAILGLGALLVLDRQLTPGAMLAASILLGRALAPVDQAIGTWKQVIGARLSYQRLRRLTREAPARPSAQPMPPLTGAVELDRVVATPPRSAPGAARAVLSGVSLRLAPGEILGVVGPSASGKTSLCRLLIGAWTPSQGHVRLDGAEVSLLPREQVGPQMGYLPQDVELIAGTVRENIARSGLGEDEAVLAAARQAGCHEMILRLPQGYETEIGEGGAVLSAGQRQRVGLARAFYGAPKLLVLDEPNAYLDQDGEDALKRAIAGACARGATVVLVTHRLGILAEVDRILVLRDGRVEALGGRDEILGRFARPPEAERGRRVRAVGGTG